MKKWMILSIASLAVPFSINVLAATHCEYRPPQDGDTSVSYPVRGTPSEKSYSYLVKKDVMGDGSNLVFYPVYSKSWLLTASQLREIVEKDHVNLIGGDDDKPEKITVIRNPQDANDFKTFKEIYFDPKSEKVCKS